MNVPNSKIGVNLARRNGEGDPSQRSAERVGGCGDFVAGPIDSPVFGEAKDLPVLIRDHVPERLVEPLPQWRAEPIAGTPAGTSTAAVPSCQRRSRAATAARFHPPPHHPTHLMLYGRPRYPLWSHPTTADQPVPAPTTARRTATARLYLGELVGCAASLADRREHLQGSRLCRAQKPGSRLVPVTAAPWRMAADAPHCSMTA